MEQMIKVEISFNSGLEETYKFMPADVPDLQGEHDRLCAIRNRLTKCEQFQIGDTVVTCANIDAMRVTLVQAIAPTTQAPTGCRL